MGWAFNPFTGNFDWTAGGSLASASAPGLVPALGADGSVLTVAGTSQLWSREFRLPDKFASSGSGSGAVGTPPGSLAVAQSLPGPAASVVTGSTATGASNVVIGADSITSNVGCFLPSQLTEITGFAYISVLALSTGGDTFTYNFGILGSHGDASTAITNMIGFRVEGAALKAVCMNGGSETTLTWTGSISANTPVFVKFRWTVGGAVTFWVNDALVDGSTGTISTNVPATSTAQKLEAAIYKTVGTTSARGYFSCAELRLKK